MERRGAPSGEGGSISCSRLVGQGRSGRGAGDAVSCRAGGGLGGRSGRSGPAGGECPIRATVGRIMQHCQPEGFSERDSLCCQHPPTHPSPSHSLPCARYVSKSGWQQHTAPHSIHTIPHHPPPSPCPSRAVCAPTPGWQRRTALPPAGRLRPRSWRARCRRCGRGPCRYCGECPTRGAKGERDGQTVTPRHCPHHPAFSPICPDNHIASEIPPPLQPEVHQQLLPAPTPVVPGTPPAACGTEAPVCP